MNKSKPTTRSTKDMHDDFDKLIVSANNELQGIISNMVLVVDLLLESPLSCVL